MHSIHLLEFKETHILRLNTKGDFKFILFNGQLGFVWSLHGVCVILGCNVQEKVWFMTQLTSHRVTIHNLLSCWCLGHLGDNTQHFVLKVDKKKTQTRLLSLFDPRLRWGCTLQRWLMHRESAIMKYTGEAAWANKEKIPCKTRVISHRVHVTHLQMQQRAGGPRV